MRGVFIRNRPLRWALVVLFWTLIGLSFASQFYLASYKAGRPVTWGQAVGWSFGDWYVIGSDITAHTYQSPNEQPTACPQATGRPALSLARQNWLAKESPMSVQNRKTSAHRSGRLRISG